MARRKRAPMIAGKRVADLLPGDPIRPPSPHKSGWCQEGDLLIWLGCPEEGKRQHERCPGWLRWECNCPCHERRGKRG
jgi:hypothetical protein